jgi:prepilin signal peptidase PulO-like enzyme (type II secretory pathway)
MQHEGINRSQSARSVKSTWSWFLGVIVLLALSLVILYTTPPPWKQVGGFVALTIMSIIIFIRAMQNILPHVNERPFLTFMVPLFLILLGGLMFASGTLQLIAGITYGIVIGVIGVCWLIWALVSSFKETFFKS